MTAVLVRAALVAAIALAAGCGQRGPLVLPDSKQQRPPATGAPAAQPPAR